MKRHVITNPLPAPSFTRAKLAQLPPEWADVLHADTGQPYKRDKRADVFRQREVKEYCHLAALRGPLKGKL